METVCLSVKVYRKLGYWSVGLQGGGSLVTGGNSKKTCPTLTVRFSIWVLMDFVTGDVLAVTGHNRGTMHRVYADQGHYCIVFQMGSRVWHTETDTVYMYTRLIHTHPTHMSIFKTLALHCRNSFIAA